MPKQIPEDDAAGRASAQSPGNEGARGSRGQANSGARPENPDDDGNERAPGSDDPDLRQVEARGGGGASSNSSRSK
jgi:hypothetical protein